MGETTQITNWMFAFANSISKGIYFMEKCECEYTLKSFLEMTERRTGTIAHKEICVVVVLILWSL